MRAAAVVAALMMAAGCAESTTQPGEVTLGELLLTPDESTNNARIGENSAIVHGANPAVSGQQGTPAIPFQPPECAEVQASVPEAVAWVEFPQNMGASVELRKSEVHLPRIRQHLTTCPLYSFTPAEGVTTEVRQTPIELAFEGVAPSSVVGMVKTTTSAGVSSDLVIMAAEVSGISISVHAPSSLSLDGQPIPVDVELVKQIMGMQITKVLTSR